MGIPVKVEDLIAQTVVESTRIEYKKSFNPESIIRTVCAFANDIDNMGAGYIIIGVEDNDGSPKYPVCGVRQEEIDGMLKKLRQYCHTIQPVYEPVVEPVRFRDPSDNHEKYVIVIWVTGGYGRPYKAPKDVTQKCSPKYFFIRKFSETVIPSAEEEKQLFYVSSNIPFDDRECLPASVDDLNLSLMQEHLWEVKSDLFALSKNMTTLELARNMHLVSGDPENVKPLNVGILMFSGKIHDYFRYARIEVVDIPDPTGTNMTEKVFTGPIQVQLRDALQYIKNYVLKEVTIKSPEKAEAERFSNYPYVAVEELLANAVYHRSYQISEPITVRITPESMEITSFPGFDRSISDRDIQERTIRARVYRNRRIGDFLKELRLIEGRNTGFPNAFAALRANGSSLPEFIQNPDRDYLSVVIPVHPYFTKKDRKMQKRDLYEQAVLNAVNDGTLTLSDISRAMGYKGISKKLSQTVQSMSASGKLRADIDGQTILYRKK